MSKLALVTILYHADNVLEDFFASVSKQTYKNYTLYLIDNSANAKTNEVIAQCLKKFPIPSFKYIDSGGNIGVAAGNNWGISLAKKDGCEHLLILNNDIVILEADAFEKIMKLSLSENLITTKIFFHDNHKIWMAGGYMDHIRALGVHYGIGKEDNTVYNIPKYITYAPTCFLYVSMKVIDEIGLMDEKYFAYYDDTDFVLRAIRKGYKLWYEPTIQIDHKVSSSSGGDLSPFYIYYGNRNKIYFIRKHYKGFHQLLLILYTLISRTFFYLKFNSEGKKKLVMALRDGFKIPLN